MPPEGPPQNYLHENSDEPADEGRSKDASSSATAPERIVVIGAHAGGDDAGLPKPARTALEQADLVVGGRRHLAALAPAARRTVLVGDDLATVLDAIDAEPGTVVVLASGDPGFFGMVRPLAARFGAGRLEVHPAPSSVALAFARLGRSWDDAVVVSAHGRPLAEAIARAARHPKVAVLVSPENSPQVLGRALIDSGCGSRVVAVCSRLGLEGEEVVETDLAGLADGTWDPLSVVVLLAPDRLPGVGTAGGTRTLAWGLGEERFDHRDGMIPRAEVRAVALGKLDLPAAGVLWDVGAGSGSVAVEAALLCPGLAVYAFERDPAEAARAVANATGHGAAVRVVVGEAPACLEGLPDPDRVFVGGGGLDVLDACLARLRSGGQVVATYAAMDRAVAAAGRLGSLTQISVSRGRRLPDGGIRLAAENPVFVVWGPRP